VNARLDETTAIEGTVQRLVQRRSPHGSREVRDLVACEVPVALHYNDVSFAVLMASPGDLADLAIGFSLSEGLVGDVAELQVDAIDETVDGIAVRMRIPAARAVALQSRRRTLSAYGGCGMCGSADIEGVLRTPPRNTGTTRITEAALHRALDALHARQPLNAATGATHAAAFATRAGDLLVVREDVGRHNALDKVIGAMASRGDSAGDGFALVTSRASYELALKAAQVGLPMLAAISAPTSLAIALADSAGVCLVAFARDGHCAVYSHAQRLLRREAPAP